MSNTKKLIFNIKTGLKLTQELSLKNKKTKQGYAKLALVEYLNNKE